jgi:hypothetical protein
MVKKIICPLKVGDRVVLCASKTHTGKRGLVGTIIEIRTNLYVSVQWDTSPLSLLTSTRVATYDIKPEVECHNCIFRLTHLIGGVCSADWKDIQKIASKVIEDGI